jgi:tetratricopeptide (TPR) repeat protein
MLRSYAVVLGIVLLINSVLAVTGGVDASAFEQAKGSLQAAIASAKEKKDTTELVRLYEQLITLIEGVFGPESIELAQELSSMAKILTMSGNYAGATFYLEKLLGLNEKIYGLDHLETARTQNNLAVNYFYLGKYEAAEKNFLLDLAFKEKTLGKK